MSVFDERKTDLERHEFMMAWNEAGWRWPRLLTDSLIMVGQHGVYCASSRNPNVPALDLQAVLSVWRSKGADSIRDGGTARAA